MNNIDFEKEYSCHTGLLLIVSGPSGAGKSQVCKSYVNEHPYTFLSVSDTTRPMREGEEEGVHYHYISEDTFQERNDNGYYLESAGVYQNHYGTPKEPIEKALKDGIDVILEIDPQGALQVKKQIEKAILIFILPSNSQVLEDQIRKRGKDSEEQIQLRLGSMLKELDYLKDYNYIVINKHNKMDETVHLLEDIVRAEKCSTTMILNS